MTPKNRIVLFGELLLRLEPEGFQRYVQADRFQVRYTGAEANVGVALTAWDWETVMLSRVPAHEIGQACINYLRRYGVDTTHIQRGGDRLGILYVESGASQRQSKVIYDRTATAFASFDDREIDWDRLFMGRNWFHFSGTVPAVAPVLVPVLERACAAAKSSGVMVSCDLNFRRKLWCNEVARQIMPRLMSGVDLLICNVVDAKTIFGIDSAESAGKADREDYMDVAHRLVQKFGFSHVALTMRESLSASRNLWSAMLHTAGRDEFSRQYDIGIIDRIGAGDAFAAGLIHGLGNGWDPARVIGYAGAAACLKHTIPGDFNLVSSEEVDSLFAGDESGRIQR